MSSSIIATNPTTGVATTQSIRDNFLYAKNEIQALQADYILQLAHTSEVTEYFQPCTVNDTPRVVEFNSTVINTAAGVFTYDPSGHEITFVVPTAYHLYGRLQVIRKISTGDLDWSSWFQTKAPGGSWVNVPGSREILSLASDSANRKLVLEFGNTGRVTVAGTKLRMVQGCTNVAKDVGIITYAASGQYPGASGVSLDLVRIGIL